MGAPAAEGCLGSRVTTPSFLSPYRHMNFWLADLPFGRVCSTYQAKNLGPTAYKHTVTCKILYTYFVSHGVLYEYQVKKLVWLKTSVLVPGSQNRSFSLHEGPHTELQTS